VFCDFQGGVAGAKKGIPTAGVFKHLAVAVCKAAAKAGSYMWLPAAVAPDTSDTKHWRAFARQFEDAADETFSETNGFRLLERYLEDVADAISPRRILLMVDEFDILQEGIESGITSPQLPDNLRYLLQQHPDFAAIISYQKLFRRLRTTYFSPLFGLGTTVTVGRMTQEDARLLVERPAAGKLVFADAAIDAITSLAACQPYLIQTLCGMIFEICDDLEGPTRSVNESIVQEAASKLGHHEYFKTLWDEYVASERQRLILVLFVEARKTPDPVNLKLIELRLEQARVTVRSQKQILEDLERLKLLDLIRMDEGGSAYHLEVPLFGDWISQNVDFRGQRSRATEESERGEQ